MTLAKWIIKFKSLASESPAHALWLTKWKLTLKCSRAKWQEFRKNHNLISIRVLEGKWTRRGDGRETIKRARERIEKINHGRLCSTKTRDPFEWKRIKFFIFFFSLLPHLGGISLSAGFEGACVKLFIKNDDCRREATPQRERKKKRKVSDSHNLHVQLNLLSTIVCWRWLPSREFRLSFVARAACSLWLCRFRVLWCVVINSLADVIDTMSLRAEQSSSIQCRRTIQKWISFHLTESSSKDAAEVLECLLHPFNALQAILESDQDARWNDFSLSSSASPLRWLS